MPSPRWPFYHRRRALLARPWWSKGAVAWGTNLSTIAPAILNANGDVTANAGGWTTAIQSQAGGTPVPLISAAAFDCYPLIQGFLVVVLGATAPSALQAGYALATGTELATCTVEPGFLVALAELWLPFFFVGPLGTGTFKPPGANPLIQVNPTGHDVTVKKVGSQALFQLIPGIV